MSNNTNLCEFAPTCGIYKRAINATGRDIEDSGCQIDSICESPTRTFQSCYTARSAPVRVYKFSNLFFLIILNKELHLGNIEFVGGIQATTEQTRNLKEMVGSFRGTKEEFKRLLEKLDLKFV